MFWLIFSILVASFVIILFDFKNYITISSIQPQRIVLLVCLISLLLFNSRLAAQNLDSIPKNDTIVVSPKTFKPARFIPFVSIVTVGYTGAMIGLSSLWYSKASQSSFQFFDDNAEWKQVDKFGHSMTAFQESRICIDMLLWSGVPRKQAILFGGINGFVMQMPIEIMDGFSKDWGASWGDIAANTVGSLLVIGQYALWDEMRIQFKYSFFPTSYAAMRPNVLGADMSTQWLKDYNGQTYWLSTNIYSFLKKESKFPKWFNVAIGYGAQEMIYAHDADNQAIGLNPYRQIYLSLDVDLERIPVKSKFLKTLFYGLNMIKMPFPAIEFNERGVRFHPFYF